MLIEINSRAKIAENSENPIDKQRQFKNTAQHYVYVFCGSEQVMC